MIHHVVGVVGGLPGGRRSDATSHHTATPITEYIKTFSVTEIKRNRPPIKGSGLGFTSPAAAIYQLGHTTKPKLGHSNTPPCSQVMSRMITGTSSPAKAQYLTTRSIVTCPQLLHFSLICDAKWQLPPLHSQ